MRVLFTLVIAFAINHSVFSQTDSICYDLSVYNVIYKNIISYNIYKASYKFNGINVEEVLKPGQLNPFNALMADFGYKLKLKFKNLDWHYPSKGYSIYEVILDPLIFEDSVNHVKVRINGPIINKRFLIGVEKWNQKILFISGQFFMHDIAGDFNINIKRPESLIEFLRFKTFQYQVEDISFLKEKRGELWYKGYSVQAGKYVIIKVPKDNLDRVSYLSK